MLYRAASYTVLSHLDLFLSAVTQSLAIMHSRLRQGKLDVNISSSRWIGVGETTERLSVIERRPVNRNTEQESSITNIVDLHVRTLWNFNDMSQSGKILLTFTLNSVHT